MHVFAIPSKPRPSSIRLVDTGLDDSAAYLGLSRKTRRDEGILAAKPFEIHCAGFKSQQVLG
jgi:hypothetical protein